MNRAAFLKELGTEWLPSLPDIHTHLLADPPARIADIGCGGGWSSIAINDCKIGHHKMSNHAICQIFVTDFFIRCSTCPQCFETIVSPNQPHDLYIHVYTNPMD